MDGRAGRDFQSALSFEALAAGPSLARNSARVGRWSGKMSGPGASRRDIG